MKLKISPISAALKSVHMRRDMRHVESALAARGEPDDRDVLDMGKVRYDIDRLIGTMPFDRVDDSVYQMIDGLIDSYLADFLHRMRAEHDLRIGELDRLRIKVEPYLRQAKALMHDDLSLLGYLDAAVTNALDRVADPETPLIDTRPPELPREREL
jgi:hypothetical protein